MVHQLPGDIYLIAYLQYTVTHVYSTLFYGDMYIYYMEGTYCVSPRVYNTLGITYAIIVQLIDYLQYTVTHVELMFTVHYLGRA